MQASSLKTQSINLKPQAHHNTHQKIQQPVIFNTNQIKQLIKTIPRNQNPTRYQHNNQQVLEFQATFQANLIRENIDVVTQIESPSHLIFALGRNKDDQDGNRVTIYLFSKQNGSHQTIEFQGVRAKIITMSFTYCKQYYDDVRMDCLNLSPFKNQIIKILHLRQKAQNQMQVVQFRQWVCRDVDRNVMDGCVYVKYQNGWEVKAIYRSALIQCDKSLSMSINVEENLLLQATRGGYIIIWKLFPQNKHNSKQSIKREENVRINQNPLQHLQHLQVNNNNLHSQKLEYNIFPQLTNHTMFIQGLIWIQYVGMLLLSISTKGMLKLTALSHENGQQSYEEYITIFEYQISYPQTIAYVRCYPQQQYILIAKNSEYEKCFIEKISYGEDSKGFIKSVTKIQIQKMSYINYFWLCQTESIFTCFNKKYICIAQNHSLFPLHKETHSTQAK